MHVFERPSILFEFWLQNRVVHDVIIWDGSHYHVGWLVTSMVPVVMLADLTTGSTHNWWADDSIYVAVSATKLIEGVCFVDSLCAVRGVTVLDSFAYTWMHELAIITERSYRSSSRPSDRWLVADVISTCTSLTSDGHLALCLLLLSMASCSILLKLLGSSTLSTRAPNLIILI